jgi:hypothetical protein
MRIQFRRREIGECVSVIHRPDGVVLELPSYSRRFRVPHDLAHAVTERELRITGGVYGLIAAGHVFPNMTVVAGRPRPDARGRSDRVMKAYGGSVTTAEVLAGAPHRAVESGHLGQAYQEATRNWGSVELDPFPWSEQDVVLAVRTLREYDERWQRVAVGSSMDFHWPESLIRPVPPPGRPAGSGRTSVRGSERASVRGSARTSIRSSARTSIRSSARTSVRGSARTSARTETKRH